MLTNKNYFLNTEITKDDFNQANVLKISDLQTDFQIKIITTSLASGINLFLSKALQISKIKQIELKNLTIPYIDYKFINDTRNNAMPATSL